MGQGGCILISNRTPLTWHQTYIHSYQMNAWDSKFPKTIAPGESVSVYVEWDQGIFKNMKDDGGEVVYKAEGNKNFKFEIRASAKQDFCLFLQTFNFGTPNHPSGKFKSLGWNHNGVIQVGIIGDQNGLKIIGNGYKANDWMLHLKDSKSLSELTIPGTHDSCALYGGDLVQCQSLDLKEQLEKGIRFLDIRCRHIDNVFAIHHGMVYQKINFTDVLNSCETFLKSNPSETIIMSVKKEYKEKKVSRSFEETFLTYLEKTPGLWYTKNDVPTLGETRGKIVLLRRFSASKQLGINGQSYWKDNDIFSWKIHDQTNKSVVVQDVYKVPTLFDIGNKWEKVKQLLERARSGDKNTLFLNYTSGVSAGAYPYSVAYKSKGINRRLQDYTIRFNNSRHGVLIMDFPERPEGSLVPILIGSNF